MQLQKIHQKDNQLSLADIKLRNDKLWLLELSAELELENKERIISCLLSFVQERHWKDILVIIHKESRGDSLAFSGQDYGIMQINRIHLSHISDRDSLWNIEYNMRFAYNEIFIKYCLLDYNNRFKRYNGSSEYQYHANKLLETINETNNARPM